MLLCMKTQEWLLEMVDWYKVGSFQWQVLISKDNLNGIRWARVANHIQRLLYSASPLSTAKTGLRDLFVQSLHAMKDHFFTVLVMCWNRWPTTIEIIPGRSAKRVQQQYGEMH